jgi:serine/threonine protein kinase
MPAPATVEEFIDLVRKSNQIDNNRFETWLAQPKEEVATSPRKLALQLIRAGVMTMFQAEQFLLGKYKGFHLGGYRIIERLGAGGAGTVYLGEHEVMKRRVALKVLPTAFAEDPGQLARFQREAQATSVLDHPNVVHVFDFRQENGLNFIVMEYIDGPNLQQVIGRRGALPYELACEYIRQAALGLHHAHEAGLVHRDVKPANLLVDSAGTVKVLDMGLALYQPEGNESLTQKFNNKMVLGTADYLAPEQALNLHEVDARADVYSLGATLHALLVGKPPFHEASIGQKLMWHQMKQPTAVNEIDSRIPQELADLVLVMLAKKPEDRFQSALEVAEALLPWAEQASQSQMRPLAKSMVEIRLESTTNKTGSLFKTSTSGKLLATPQTDTWITRASADTKTIERQRQKEQEETPVTAAGPTARATPQNKETAKVPQDGMRKLLTIAIAIAVGLTIGFAVFWLFGRS